MIDRKEGSLVRCNQVSSVNLSTLNIFQFKMSCVLSYLNINKMVMHDVCMMFVSYASQQIDDIIFILQKYLINVK